MISNVNVLETCQIINGWGHIYRGSKQPRFQYGVDSINNPDQKIFVLVLNLVRHRDLADRETDGAVLWNSMFPKLRRNEGAQTFSDSQWLDHVDKGSKKLDFNVARTHTTSSCIFAPFTGTQEES